jgi:M6 family metalloprotease-like protein
MRNSLTVLGSALLIALAGSGVEALEKPSQAEIARYRRDGSLAQRAQRAYEIGNHRVKPGLAADAAYRLQLELWKQGQLGERPTPPNGRLTPPSGWKGMPTTGNVKILALLIEFSDILSTNTAASINGKLFGDGVPADAPRESVRNYYRRASFNQLEIGGNTLGWYRTAYPRSSVPQTYAGREALIKEALNSFDAAGHDFTQYDNDGDGAIDYFVVIWTGPDNGWANFWWGYQTSFSDGSYLLDGKRLRDYSWQWEARPTPGTFYPTVVIHETGHALGLPDYYDYDASVGPGGGLGGLDMMDGNWGDHNCFSKFLLDWLTPTVVSGGLNTVSLRSAGSFGDAVIFSKGATSQPFAEYFMVQNRTRTGNDTPYPADGLLVWHLDARLNGGGSNYLYDNSYTSHKLLRLMEADGLEQIEAGLGANAGDYYVTGKTFGPGSYPSIARYDSAPNPMLVNTISAAGSPMSVHIDEIVDPTGPTGAPSTPTDEGVSKAGDSLVFNWTQGSAADPESGIVAYQLQVGTTPGGNDKYDGLVGNVLTWTVTDAADGATYYARVRAINGVGTPTAWSGNSDGIIVNLPVFPCAALDNCGLVFKTAGNAAWFEEAATVYYGSTAAQGGDIADNQSTYLQTTVTGPGTFSFWWKVSSESGWDYLRVFVDGVSSATPISGETAWAQVSLSIPAGTHVIRWKYTKDTSYSSGSDTGWVDRVEWTGPGSPSLSINDVTVTEGNSGTTVATFAVTLSAPSASTVTVNYATANGTATAGSDYLAASGTLTFNAGQTSRTVVVTVNGDVVVEPNETFYVNLSSASGATIADAQGLGTITNDDVAGADFHTVSPCRVLDSRLVASPWGGTPLAGGHQRDLTIGAACGIPLTAQAVSVNITAVDATADGHLRIFSVGTPLPTASVLNFRAGLTRANNAIVQLGSAATITIFSGQPAGTGTVHVVLDVNGWFE